MSAENCIAGLWKFGETILQPELIGVAKSWLFDTDGRQYERIEIRQYAPNKYGIDFRYKLDGIEMKDFIYRISDKLRRQFGNDLVGWDIGPVEWSYDDHWGSLASLLRSYVAQVTDVRLDELYQELYRQGWMQEPQPLSTRHAGHHIRSLVMSAVSCECVERREGCIKKVE